MKSSHFIIFFFWLLGLFLFTNCNNKPIIQSLDDNPDQIDTIIKESELLYGFNVDSFKIVGDKVKKDEIIIHGKCELKKGGIEIETNLDHRMAMSALVMGLVSKKEVKIDNYETIKTSFPSFYKVMLKIGAKLSKK